MPLSYIIRRQAAPIPLGPNANGHAEREATTILAGPQYQADNGAVFDILQ